MVAKNNLNSLVHSSTKLSRLLAQCSLKAKPLNSLVRRFEPSTLLVSLECQNVILQERCHESRPPIFAQTLHLGPLWTGWNILGKRGLEQFRKIEKFHEDFFYQIKRGQKSRYTDPLAIWAYI